MKSRSNFIDILSVIVAVVLFLAVLALSIYGVKLSLEQFDKTCYADSSNGVVEPNLLLNNDCSTWSYQPYGSSNDKVLWSLDGQIFYVYVGYGLTVNLNTFIAPNTTDLQRIYYVVSDLTVGQTYTFSYYLSACQGEYRIRVYQDGTNSYSAYNQTAGLISYTFTCTSSEVRLFAQFRGTATVDWFKLELGSSFTGYVPKDYTNYGYNQGYDNGVKDTADRLNLNNGVEVLGSVSEVALKYGRDFVFLQYNTSFTLYGQQGSSIFPPYDEFTYNGYTYSMYGPPVTGQPQYWLFMSYDRDTYEMTINISSFGGLNYIPILPFCYDLVYIGQPIYITSDFVLGASYNVIIRSTDGTQTIFINNFTPTGQFNGENFLDVSNYLVNGQSYNFYVYNSSSDISITTKNSYYTGLHSLCVFTINDAYTVGVNNYNQGFDEGYQKGYDYGDNMGFDRGYRAGVLEHTDYSFLGLIGAVFDAPVQAFSGLLDFNLLGVNLKSFVLALLSLSVIIIVIKIALGGS